MELQAIFTVTFWWRFPKQQFLKVLVSEGAAIFFVYIQKQVVSGRSALKLGLASQVYMVERYAILAHLYSKPQWTHHSLHLFFFLSQKAFQVPHFLASTAKLFSVSTLRRNSKVESYEIKKCFRLIKISSRTWWPTVPCKLIEQWTRWISCWLCCRKKNFLPEKNSKKLRKQNKQFLIMVFFQNSVFRLMYLCPHANPCHAASHQFLSHWNLLSADIL